MPFKLKFCENCKKYTMQENCKTCKKTTKQAGYKFIQYKINKLR